MTTEPVSTPGTCSNCGADLTGPYCAQCGRPTTSAIPSLREFLTEAWDEFGGIERRFVRTLRLVLTRPGMTTLEIASGRGAAHVTPLRMYLALALVYFAVAALTPADVTLVVGFGFINGDEFVNRWVPRIVFLGIPTFAALLWLFYRQSGYVRHLIFAMYLHAAIYATNVGLEVLVTVSGLLGFDGATVFAPLLNAWFPVYLFLALRRLEGGWRKPLLVALAVTLAYALVWGILTLALLVGSGEIPLEQLLSRPRPDG